MGTENPGLKRSLSEVEDAESAVRDQKIAEQVTNNNGTSRPAPKKPRVEERRSIFVRSLPTEVTNERLTEFFSEYFPVKHATVITDQKTKQSRGYGFVTFADAEDAQQAKVALDKKEWDGRRLRIEIAEPRHRNGPAGAAPTIIPGKPEKDDTQQPPKLIVRNLPWSIKTPEQLSKLFLSFGKVKYSDLPQSKGKLKGFGFVTLRGRKNAEKALEGINGKEIDGRTLAVDWAVDKATWADKQQDGPSKLPSAEQQEGDEDDDDATSSEGTSSESEAEDSEDGDNEPRSSKPVNQELEDDLKNFFKNHMQNLEDEDDDEDDDDVEEEEEDDDEPGNPVSENQGPPRTVDNSSTVFVRNLPFTTTDDQLKDFFATFGPVRYARVVVDKATDKPTGAGFVCFFNESDAKTCIKEAPQPQQQHQATHKTKNSILQDDNADPEGRYTLDGRLLRVAQAVTRETASDLAESALAKRREKDKRRLFLLQEGNIGPKSPLFKLLSETETRMRQVSAVQRKKMVEKNPSLHLSLTRLALRNIPRNIGSKELKDLARKAIVGFAKDVKEGRRQPLSKEENSRDGKDAKERERERRQKGKGIVRQAKIVFESKEGSKVAENSGAGKSRGYGFIEYTSHHWALMGLRYLNGLQLEGDNGRKQRLIVEFSIENAQVVQRRKAIEHAGAQPPKPRNQDDAKKRTKSNAENDNERTARVLRDNKAGRGERQDPKKGKKSKDDNIAPEGKPSTSDAPFDLQSKLMARKRQMKKKKAAARGKK